MPSVIVNTKITIPRQRSDVIQRSRLLQILDDQTNANIYLIHAPAGYGKTTIILDWIQIYRGKNKLISWFAIDASDNEKIAFAMYFTSALEWAFPDDSEFGPLMQRLRGMTDVDLMWLMKSILNLLSGMDVDQVIILDDYHEINNNDIHEALSYFLEYIPQHTKVVICTRTTPPFPFARWQVRARLCEVGQDDLKFKVEEVSRFLLEGMKLNLQEDQISYITDRTEGWAAGLQLAGINLIGKAGSQWTTQSFQGNQQVLLTYLMEEVYEDLPETIQQFLLKTSIFPRFSTALCDAILMQPEAAEDMLIEIERKHLFLVELDDAHTWFRYHHLFSAFLQSKFGKEQPKKKQALHLLASQWFKEQQYFREAVQQAFMSEDWQVAANMVCELGFYMIIHSEISVLYEWTVTFPEEVMRQNPLLCILQSWALVYRYQKQNRMRIEARLQQAEQIITELQDAVEVANLTEHLAVVRTFLAMAPDPDVDINRYLQIAQEMLAPYPTGHPGQYSAQLTIAYAYMAMQRVKEAEDALLRARESAFAGQLYFGYVEATFHLARVKQACGHLQQAKSLCLSGKSEIKSMLPNAEQLLPALGSLDIALGCIQLEENEIDLAMQSVQDGLTLLGSSSNPFYLFVAFDALAKGSLFAGDIGMAKQFLNQLSELWPDIAFYSHGMLIWCHLHNEGRLSDYEKDAINWCNEIATVFSNDAFIPGIGPLGATEVYYQTALCWMRLKTALGQSDDINFLHQQLLKKAVDQEIIQRKLELELISDNKKSSFDLDQSTLIEPLSERELEVMQLIGQGADNQLISEKLFITVGTVKSHINHIFRKLDVKNRTEAVAKLRKMGMDF